MKRFLKLIALTLALVTLPVLALAATGSAAVTEGQTYTLAEMLTYALQDEYMAEAEYAAIQAAFGVNNPYANIQQAEISHQEELLPLFAAYGVAVPENTAAGSVVVPATLQETYEIGVQAEINNIAMYQAFLAQSDLPDDVRAVFTELMNASQSHLEAFSRNAEKTGLGLGSIQNRTDVSTQTYGGRMAAMAAASTQGYGSRMAAQTVTYGRNSAWQAASFPMRGMGQRNVSTGIRTMDTDSCPMLDDAALQQTYGGGRWN